jgi:hypothetical protein
MQRLVVRLDKRYLPLVMNRDFKRGSVLLASRIFQYVVHICGQRMEVDWAKESSVNESRILAQVQYDSRTVQLFRSANIGRLKRIYEARH